MLNTQIGKVGLDDRSGQDVPLTPHQRRGISSHQFRLPPQLEGPAGRIGEIVKAGGFYEAEMLVHIHQANIGGIYLDVGANIGNHMMFFATRTPASHVFAFEPISKNVSTCKDFAELNDVGHKVSVIPFAASDSTGMVVFYTKLRPNAPKRKAVGVRIDDIAPPGVGLIKMDIEGSEPTALRGAQRVLAEDKPALYIEAHDDNALNEILSVVSPFGYHLTGAVFNASPTYEIVHISQIDYFKALKPSL